MMLTCSNLADLIRDFFALHDRSQSDACVRTLTEETELGSYLEAPEDPAKVSVLRKELAKTLSSLWCLSVVIAPDEEAAHQAFTACQAKQVRLPRSAFCQLRDRVMRVTCANTGLARLSAALLVHDLGKTPLLVRTYQDLTGQPAPAGHDELVAEVFMQRPDVLPSAAEAFDDPVDSPFAELLRAHFNLLQFVQGECPAGALQGIQGLSEEAYHLLVAEAILDLAGVAGQAPGAGSIVLNAPTWQAVAPALEALDRLHAGQLDVQAAYDCYIAARAGMLGLDATCPAQYTLARVGCMLRWLTPEQGAELCRAYSQLHELDPTAFIEQPELWRTLPPEHSGAAMRLVDGLTASGIGGSRALLLEYAPDLVQVIQKQESSCAALHGLAHSGRRRDRRHSKGHFSGSRQDRHRRPAGCGQSDTVPLCRDHNYR